MNEEKEMSERELVLNIQILQEQSKVLASNVEMLTMYLQELATSKATLEGTKTLKKGDEILVPIGASSFVRARIEDTETVITGIGAALSIDKAIDQAIEDTQERITLTEQKIRDNQEAYMQVSAKLEELGAEAQTRLQKGENV